MSKLKECPNCLGTGEIIVGLKKQKKCPTCSGDGLVHPDVREAFLDSLMPETFDEDDW